MTSPRAPAPISLAAAESDVAAREQIATRTPSCPSPRAIALPMPFLAHVTRAVVPFSSTALGAPFGDPDLQRRRERCPRARAQSLHTRAGEHSMEGPTS